MYLNKTNKILLIGYSVISVILSQQTAFATSLNDIFATTIIEVAPSEVTSISPKESEQLAHWFKADLKKKTLTFL